MSTISLLRNKILEQAIRGELVAQNSEDGHASILIQQIQNKKQAMENDKVIKKSKKLPKIEESEIPFPLAEGWEWVRLGELVSKLGAGKTPLGGEKNYTDSGIKFIRSQNVKNEGLDVNGIAHIPEKINKTMQGSLVKKNDILLNITGASIGRSCLLPEDFDTANVNQHVAIIRLIEPDLRKYIHKCIISPFIQDEIMNVQVGVSREGLSMDKLARFIIPIPPLAEQKRIVEKIEELFSLCDQWEQEVELQQERIETLRNKVLGDALQGFLVPQSEEDESADVLLEKIQAKKEELVKNKEISKSKPLSPIEEKEKTYELPQGWTWVKLGDLSKVIHYGYTASATDKNTGVRMVRITDIQDDSVNWDNVPYCEIDNDSIKKYDLKDNDILIARTGGTVGKSFIVEEAKYLSVFASYLIRVQLMDGVNAKYVKLFLDSNLYWKQIENQAKGTGQPNVNATGLSNLILPLPPIEEQHRIVEKVNTLWETINEIENNIVKAK